MWYDEQEINRAQWQDIQIGMFKTKLTRSLKMGNKHDHRGAQGGSSMWWKQWPDILWAWGHHSLTSTQSCPGLQTPPLTLGSWCPHSTHQLSSFDWYPFPLSLQSLGKWRGRRREEETEEESRRWKEPGEALLLERDGSVLSPLAVVSPY